MSRLTLLSLLVFSPLALAFSNTAPLLAWSSHSSNFIDRLPSSSSSVSGTLHSKNVFETMLMNDDVCDHEAVILVHQPGLHVSDLRKLPKTSHIARSISAASSSRQYAYVPAMFTSGENEHHLEFAQSVSQKCHARLINILAGQGGDVDFQAGGQKSVVVVNLPGVEGSQSESRINGMVEHDALLFTTLDALPFSNLVVIYTGTPPMHSKRQEDLNVSAPARPVLDLTQNEAASSSPSILAKKNKGGILHNYQLLTPGLIMVLLMVLFIFLPVLYFGISAMASIQSPLRLDSMPKGYNANERKNQ
ncbi:BIG/ATPase V1 complex, subunit S1 [Lentinula edodes]|uniref:BIG/ATPase V1 complex, subunit S1 n=1 Tax=Lentinula edodes TaxID=5353 RepID=UPI001E8D3253|nr:BIG/ATPase V1 complex, subunit S1 [Lentinula edodes]KAH7878051.1 BIG/ATPase V1 complex, subunit S1 [Lentinula edodes]